MTKEQIAAAKALKRALQKCKEVGLGVYSFDGISVCPQPAGRNHPDWNDHPTNAISELGELINVPGLDTDGGAGV